MDMKISFKNVYQYITKVYKNATKTNFFLESYEGINIMVDYFKDNLKINERDFLNKFNKALTELLSYYGNMDSILGRMPAQLIFNEKHKKKFIEILPLPKDDIVNIIKSWTKETSRQFGGTTINDRTIKEIFSLTFPYLYIAFTTQNEELRNNILFMVNLLMYSMSYATIFPNFDFIKDKGEYVLQNVLVNKGYAKYESIWELIDKTAIDTYETFSKRPLTDRVLYEITWSNIQTKMKYYMKQFYSAYVSVGNKYLTTTKDVLSTKDRDGETSLVDSNIESDSAVINRLVKDVVTYVGTPTYIEDKILTETLSKIMGINTRAQRQSIEKKTLVERNITNMIIELQKTRDFDLIIHNIFSNFLWSDKTGRTGVNQIETPEFISKIISDISYIKKSNIYIGKIIELLDIYISSVLSGRGKNIADLDNKTIQRYRKSLIYYYALLCQLVMKRN